MVILLIIQNITRRSSSTSWHKHRSFALSVGKVKLYTLEKYNFKDVCHAYSNKKNDIERRHAGNGHFHGMLAFVKHD